MTAAKTSAPETSKPAGDVKPGDQLIERDGALLTVASVEVQPRGMVLIQFERYGIGGAPRARVRRTTKVRCLGSAA